MTLINQQSQALFAFTSTKVCRRTGSMIDTSFVVDAKGNTLQENITLSTKQELGNASNTESGRPYFM